MTLFGVDGDDNWSLFKYLPKEIKILVLPIRGTMSIVGLMTCAVVLALVLLPLHPNFYLLGVRQVFIPALVLSYVICGIERRVLGWMIGVSCIVFVTHTADVDQTVAAWPSGISRYSLVPRYEVVRSEQVCMEHVELWKSYEYIYRPCILLAGFLLLCLAVRCDNAIGRLILMIASASLILTTMYVRGPCVRRSFTDSPPRFTEPLRSDQMKSMRQILGDN
jgi:hypothetical protein